MFVVSPPFVVTQASLVIADGVWVTLCGLAGMGIAAADLRRAGSAYSGMCLFTLLVQLALYDVGSVGFAAMAIPVGSLQVILTTAMMVMPAYMGAHLEGEDPILLDDSPTTQKRQAASAVAV